MSQIQAPVAHPRRSAVQTLAAALHDTVIQRLCGVSFLLHAQWDDGCQHQELCRREIIEALAELRGAITMSLEDMPPTRRDSQHELEVLRRTHGPLVRIVQDVAMPTLPAEVQELIDTALAEALRNINKHALPQSVEIQLDHGDDTVTLLVRNDGVEAAAPGRPGLGLRLLQMDAVSAGGIVEFNRAEPDVWTLRLMLPVAS